MIYNENKNRLYIIPISFSFIYRLSTYKTIILKDWLEVPKRFVFVPNLGGVENIFCPFLHLFCSVF